jgi:signal transduction histidine kinase
VRLILTILFFSFLVAFTSSGQQVISYNTSDGLPQPFVYCLEGDSLGKVWIGTGNGLATFNGSKLTEEITQFETGNRFISTSIIDRHKQIWFGHYVGNVSHRSSTGWHTIQGATNTKVVKLVESFEGIFVVHQDAIGQLKKNEISLLHQVKNTNLQLQDAVLFNAQLFVATNNGIWRYFNHNFEQISFKGKNVSSLGIVNDQLIVGISNGDLFQWKIEYSPKLLTSLKSKINCIVDINNMAWIGTQDGVYVLNNTWKTSSSFKLGTNITDVYEDIAGNTWLSSYGDGIFCISNEQFYPINYQYEAAINNELGGFYLANENVISSLSWLNNKWEFTTLYKLPNDHQISNLYLRKNKLYIGTYKHGLNILDLATISIEPFEYNNFLLDKKIHDFCIDLSGTWWISASLSGVLNFNPDTDEINFFDTSNGLTHNDIYHVQDDSLGGVWMATKGSGIVYSFENKFSYYSFNEGLNHLDITGLSINNNNRLVVSTSGGGLSIFNEGVFRSVTVGDGLPTNFIQNIAYINDDVYWLLTPSGLCLFDAKNISFKTYSEKLVPNNITFNNANVAVSKDGSYAAFTSNKGLLLYRKVKSNLPSKQINLNIESVTANEIAVDFKKQISLPYKRQNISIKAELISYGQSTPIELEYKLYDLDTVWIGPIKQNTINFSSLRDDDYQITVRIANTPSTEKTIHLTILKPFWKAWWFIICSIIVVLSIIYGIFKVRVYRLKQYNKELEEKVTHRTLQLSNRNKQLEQFTYTISHDLKNPSINLVELIKILHPNMQDHPDLAIFNMLEKTSSNMYNTLIELLNVLKATQEKGLKLEVLKVQEIIDDTIISIKHSIEKNKANITVNLNQETFLFHKPHLQSIVYNLVSNAIKYKQLEVAPEIHIESYVKDGFNCLTVKDNGLGVDMKKDGEKLFGMFQRLHNHVEGTGVGLHLIHSIIQEAGGRIDVDSQIGVGTTFTVYLPLTPTPND